MSNTSNSASPFEATTSNNTDSIPAPHQGLETTPPDAPSWLQPSMHRPLGSTSQREANNIIRPPSGLPNPRCNHGPNHRLPWTGDRSETHRLSDLEAFMTINQVLQIHNQQIPQLEERLKQVEAESRESIIAHEYSTAYVIEQLREQLNLNEAHSSEADRRSRETKMHLERVETRSRADAHRIRMLEVSDPTTSATQLENMVGDMVDQATKAIQDNYRLQQELEETKEKAENDGQKLEKATAHIDVLDTKIKSLEERVASDTNREMDRIIEECERRTMQQMQELMRIEFEAWKEEHRRTL